MNTPTSLDALPLDMTPLAQSLDKTVTVETTEGRVIMGILRSYDRVGNLVVDSGRLIERVDNYFSEVLIGTICLNAFDTLYVAVQDPEESPFASQLVRVSPEDLDRTRAARAAPVARPPMQFFFE
jgi:small nuclear ribonucleoprotein (snRNP)-like protein